MSKKRVLCKFFAHGACLKGEFCEFAHDWTAPANNVCTFYQRGACSYGSRCRYDHVKVSRPLPSPSASPANLSQCMFAGSTPVTYSSGAVSGGADHLPSVTAEVSAPNKTSLAPDKPAWDKNLGDGIASDSSDIGESRSLNPADRPICSFAAAGNCPHGELCPHMHGDLCPTCGKHCLHPFRPQEREEHLRTCKKRQNHLEALKRSQEVECSVCLERVLSKPTAAERKFGILSECDHPFCISCIRNWRSSSPSHGMDVNSALRACPICRKLSYFVIPSVIWYSSKEEKEEIVESYRTKLRSIDCKHFDFGNGTCPFGTSCFYKHTVRPGSYMWNAALMPDLRSSSIMNREGTDGISDTEQNSALLYMFQHVYHPHTPLGMEMEDFSSEEDLDDAMALLFWLNLVDGSGSSSDDDFEIR